ncbi:glycosyltransferase family 61 protein [Candidatus Gracilibacteria bacterium]|nr:glycosyltransferase family 61 protein [Candidatus Gracilibacteria bacterium]NJP22164.1 glycosyltransferase family 61 protein [Hydrococcus sp. CRU_1_1]
MKNLLRAILEDYNLYLPTRIVFEKFKYIFTSLKTGLARLTPPFSKSMIQGYYSFSLDYWKTCQKNNIVDVTYKTFTYSQTLRTSPPNSIYDRIHENFEKKLTLTNPDTFLISASNCRVIGDEGAVITHDNKLLADVSRHFRVKIDNINLHPELCRLELPKGKELPGTVAVLATAGGYNYYHWLLDVLPRLEIINNTFSDYYHKIDKFLINKVSSFTTQSLAMLEVNPDKVFPLQAKSHFLVEHLIIPSLPGELYAPSPWICDFLRNNFLKQKADIQPIKRLYISRAKARRRKILNEQEVVNCLQKWGFTPVYLEQYSFVEQIALLANAEALVAPHGAGLTNLLWCQVGTKALEIFSPRFINPCFWAIANQVNVDYFYLIGRGKITSTPNYLSNDVLSDILVPLDDLQSSLELMSL